MPSSCSKSLASMVSKACASAPTSSARPAGRRVRAEASPAAMRRATPVTWRSGATVKAPMARAAGMARASRSAAASATMRRASARRSSSSARSKPTVSAPRSPPRLITGTATWSNPPAVTARSPAAASAGGRASGTWPQVASERPSGLERTA